MDFACITAKIVVFIPTNIKRFPKDNLDAACKKWKDTVARKTMKCLQHNLISLISVDSQSASKTQPGGKKNPQVFGEKRPF